MKLYTTNTVKWIYIIPDCQRIGNQYKILTIGCIEWGKMAHTYTGFIDPRDTNQCASHAYLSTQSNMLMQHKHVFVSMQSVGQLQKLTSNSILTVFIIRPIHIVFHMDETVWKPKLYAMNFIFLFWNELEPILHTSCSVIHGRSPKHQSFFSPNTNCLITYYSTLQWFFRFTLHWVRLNNQ